ncbi:hypothetical protein B0I37DRAFT_348733 [Chaetomium sp. MPI-CAGE-AT-0009]|nr:hypothetical protein B0I37DRAFT_348733 [Chaetomium sp. MPI-CAGE-AT-0009]
MSPISPADAGAPFASAAATNSTAPPRNTRNHLTRTAPGSVFPIDPALYFVRTRSFPMSTSKSARWSSPSPTRSTLEALGSSGAPLSESATVSVHQAPGPSGHTHAPIHINNYPVADHLPFGGAAHFPLPPSGPCPQQYPQNDDSLLSVPDQQPYHNYHHVESSPLAAAQYNSHLALPNTSASGNTFFDARDQQYLNPNQELPYPFVALDSTQSNDHMQSASPVAGPVPTNSMPAFDSQTYIYQRNDPSSSHLLPQSTYQETPAFGAPASEHSFFAPLGQQNNIASSEPEYSHHDTSFPVTDSHHLYTTNADAYTGDNFQGGNIYSAVDEGNEEELARDEHDLAQSVALMQVPQTDIHPPTAPNVRVPVASGSGSGHDAPLSTAPPRRAVPHHRNDPATASTSGGAPPSFNNNAEPAADVRPPPPAAKKSRRSQREMAWERNKNNNPNSLLKLPGSVRAPSSPNLPVVNLGIPVPPNIDPRYWRKVYNRADSRVADGWPPATTRQARADGLTRQLAYELLAQDVAKSLATQNPQSDRGTKDRHLRAASLRWVPNQPLLARLAGRGIVLHRSDWPPIAAPAVGPPVRACPANPVHGFHWMTNV